MKLFAASSFLPFNIKILKKILKSLDLKFFCLKTSTLIKIRVPQKVYFLS